jgi:hypothetical protein
MFLNELFYYNSLPRFAVPHTPNAFPFPALPAYPAPHTPHTTTHTTTNMLHNTKSSLHAWLAQLKYEDLRLLADKVSFKFKFSLNWFDRRFF